MGTSEPEITEPTLPEGGKPKGNYEQPDSNDSRPKELQNAAADLLANRGYDVEMLPDCFSPKSATPVRNIWSTVKAKTEKQASRIDLDDFTGSIDDVPIQFKQYKIDTLEELLIIKDGKVIRVVFP